MAKLNDFLGVLASSVCDARVNSDMQTLSIAKEYASDENPDKDLLKHFSIPRMRIDKVEFNIPVGIDDLAAKRESTYQLTDIKRFSEKTYNQILTSLNVTRLSSETSKKLRTSITDFTQLLKAEIRVRQPESSLEKYSKDIALQTIGLAEIIFKEQERRKPTKAQLKKIQTNITLGLQSVLKEEIVFKETIKGLENLNVIVEADRLREIKPENVIMIKMTISEQGMEWVNMEDVDGKEVNKLMPE